MSRSGKPWIVFFVGASILGFSGCGTKQPVTPARSTDANAGPSTPPEADLQLSVVGAPRTSPPTANTNPSSEQADPKPPYTAPPKTPPRPTAEQLAKWNISEAEPLQLLACYDGFSDNVLQALAATPDGKQFVVGGTRLTLWNVGDAEPLKDLLADKRNDQVARPILAAAISPDGTLLAAGDHDGRLFAWNLSDHSEVFAIKAHEARLTQLAFSPDSKTIATTSYNGEVRLWQAADGAKIKVIKGDKQEIDRLLFVSNEVLATAGNSVVLWNVESGEKQATLTKGNVISPLLALSHDGRWLIHADEESRTQVWDIQTKAAADWQFPGAAHDIAFSPDGKWIATASRFAPVRIYSSANRQVVQVLDVNGGHIVGLKWLGDSGALTIASELGRVRIWGTVAARVKLGLTPLEQPTLREIVAGTRAPLSPAQQQQIVEVRALPRLPNAIDGFQYGGTTTYNAPATIAEAEMFYRHFLAKAGWEELPTDPQHPGLVFHKQGCQLGVSLSQASMPRLGREGDLQVSLHLDGNYDVRWLPKIAPIASKSEYSSFSNLSYRSKSSLTDLEVALLKKFHELGWTPYTRLRASSAEEPLRRSFDMLQGGSVLQVSIGFPGDSSEELYVQTNVSTTNLALPIPPDAGWIEFDASTDIAMVANTKMNLQEAIAFYDKEMALDGWLARQAGRHVDEKDQEKHKAWLPYIRGQQDVVIRLVSLPDGGTRVLVGEADRSSYQLAEVKSVRPDVAKDGIEAADFKLPTGASAIQFDADDKRIEFTSADKPTKIAAQFIEQMEALGWKRQKSGFIDDEYSFLTYEKGKAAIELRANGAKEKSTASISGDGLLWTKPLPMDAVRITYETWLRRNHKLASLEHLDDFAAEMAKIPASVKGK